MLLQNYRTHFGMKREIYSFLATRYGQSPSYWKLAVHCLAHNKHITVTKSIAIFLRFAGYESASFRDMVDSFDNLNIQHALGYQKSDLFYLQPVSGIYKMTRPKGKNATKTLLLHKQHISCVVG